MNNGQKNEDASQKLRFEPHSAQQTRPRGIRWGRIVLLVLLEAMLLAGCSLSPFPATTQQQSGGSGPPSITVTISPASTTLLLGQTQQFQAAVSGTSNTAVNWSVSGVAAGNSTVGTITSAGLYTAPAILPSNTAIRIEAASVENPTATGSATLTLTDNVVVAISPSSATISAGAAQVFAATVTGSGSPSTAITWSVNGIVGGSAATGTIAPSSNNQSVQNSTPSQSATYTAPATMPPSPNITVTATSVADTTKTASATVTISCADSISPTAASVSLAQTQTFAANFCVSSSTPVAWDVNGIAGGNSAVGTITTNGNRGSASPANATGSAAYTAPANLPANDPVTIHAVAGGTTASATVTITSTVQVAVAPASATLNASQRATFTASVTNTPDAAVTWTVNGVLDGNPALGEICVVASNPCVAPNGAVSGSVDYVAPVAAPPADPVTLTATSKADPSQSGSATVFIATQTGPISVSVSPAYSFVAPSGTEANTAQFFATVSGSNNGAVAWSVQSAVAGQGCAGAACGSIDATGLYTAPSAAPSPNAIAVIAASAADPTKSGSAMVAITSGPTIQVLLPSSVMAGAVESLPFEVEGLNFTAGSGSAASTILLNGIPRDTTCESTMACATVLNPSDVQSAATMTVQIQNPGTPGALSNPVPFVIIPFDVSTGVINLAESASAASGQDIIVVEPTTAAASAPIDVDFIGFLTGGNNCEVQGSPLTVTRPSSGSQTVSLCIHGNGLNPTFTYAFTGPSGGDITVAASSITGLFPNMIELDLTLTGATLTGVRSLFITTLNNDRAVATGMLEVQ